MSEIRVEINKKDGIISVYNDGRGIPVTIHKKENVYIPEFIFGQLLTSSNYDDDEKKITGGRNGFGAKLCNIFSKEFIVETNDRENKKHFLQIFRNNMGIREDPVIGPAKGKDFTKITFKPDFARFGMSGLDDDTVSLLTRRVFDLTGTVKSVKVFLNERQIPTSGFKEYVKLYFDPLKELQPIFDTFQRWQVAFVLGEEKFQHVSFVNSISTPKGGTHVTHVLDQIISSVTEQAKKKEKGLDVKPAQVKANTFLFVNSLIENPSFDTQTKENLTLKPAKFGSKCVLSNSFINGILKSGLLERVAAAAKMKQTLQLRKTDGHKTSKLRGVPKLDDANNAGTKKGTECTLILTEGDSAKALAVSGLSVVGRDNYGVFPLRGKLLNVREAGHKQLMENAEINNIKKIMGLQHGKDYKTLENLRYGHIMIMTDQDFDGSHIKGLIINMLEHFFPSLLKISGFLLEFITPIVRATSGQQQLDFFAVPEFEEWFSSLESTRGWHIKYYKGLGTSTAQDAKKYFSNLSLHVKEFGPATLQDQERIELAFSKKRVEARKLWLKAFVRGTYLDNRLPIISISDFIDKELILFSMADNVRSIPNVIDGLKPGQRKVLFSCFKRNLRGEIKVAQLAGYVAEHSAYHHGEQSLCMTIVNLAQDFVGSNNVPLLQPIGQFGTRLQGGRDAASPRYIFTSLSPLTRILFKEEDDPLLAYLKDDNMSIEPENYFPVLPLVLINGAEGIGTGWSTSIPCYNPEEVAENIKRKIAGKEFLEMAPWYRGFTGKIAPAGSRRFETAGVFEAAGRFVNVYELPVGVWTQTFKELLEGLLEAGDIRDFREYNTDTSVHFEISPGPGSLDSLVKKLKLSSSISTNNMVCFDPSGAIRKYEKAEEILEEFFVARKEMYCRRKEHILKTLRGELLVLENRARFVEEIVCGSLEIMRRREEDIVGEMERREYLKKDGSFEYLLGMKISSLTSERVKKLKEEEEKKRGEIRALEKKTAESMWLEDIEEFLAEYRRTLGAPAVPERGRKAGILQKRPRRAGANKAQRPPEKKRGEGEKKGEKWIECMKRVLSSDDSE